MIVELGDLTQVTPKTIEGMFAGDLAFLQDLYQRINLNGSNQYAVTCPHCEQMFEVELDSSGE